VNIGISKRIIRRLALAMVLACFPIWLAALAFRQDELNSHLVSAVKRCDISTVATLLNEGADPNACDRDAQGQPFWVHLFHIVRGTKPDGSRAPSCLDLALTGYEFDQLSGEWRTTFDRKPSPPDNPRLAELLLDHGADGNRPDPFGEAPLLRACSDWKWQTANLLIDRGMNVNVRGYLDLTPLLLAVMHGNGALVKKLLKKGANPDVQDEPNGWTPLMFAVCYGREDIIRSLLDANGNVRVKARNGQDSLDYARDQHRSRKIISMLESKRENLN
jgi:FOG: Ankyrin repeat